MQGFGKFGFYEIFKDVYKKALGPSAEKYQTMGFLTASACAEVIADCLLCPMEAVRNICLPFKNNYLITNSYLIYLIY
jgi:solute carrier family 25 phosphate transporter 3